MKAIDPLVIKPTTWVKGQPMEYSGWTGTPITFPMQNANWYGGRGGHIGFSPIIPQNGTRRWNSSNGRMRATRNTGWITPAASRSASST